MPRGTGWWGVEGGWGPSSGVGGKVGASKVRLGGGGSRPGQVGECPEPRGTWVLAVTCPG